MENNHKTYNKTITSQEEYLEIISDFLGLQNLNADFIIPKPVIYLREIKRVENSNGIGADITYSCNSAQGSPTMTTKVWMFDYEWSQSAPGRTAKRNRRIKQKSRKILAKSAYSWPVTPPTLDVPKASSGKIEKFLMRVKTMEDLNAE